MPKNFTKRILQDARNLIDDPERWTQGSLARNAEGETCQYSNGHSFCLLGAIYRATFDDSSKSSDIRDLIFQGLNPVGRAEGIVIDIITERHPHDSTNSNGIGGFNDTSTHSMVLEVLDQAIERA